MRKAIGWLEVAGMFFVIALIAFFRHLEKPPIVEGTPPPSASSAAFSAIPIDPVEGAWEDGWSKAEADLASPKPWDPKFTVRVATAFYNDPPARSDNMTESEAREAGYDKRLQQWVRKKYKRLPAGEIGQWAVDASRPWEVFARYPVCKARPGENLAVPWVGARVVWLDVDGTLQTGSSQGRINLAPPMKAPQYVFVHPLLYVREDGVYHVFDLRIPALIHRVHAQMVE